MKKTLTQLSLAVILAGASTAWAAETKDVQPVGAPEVQTQGQVKPPKPHHEGHKEGKDGKHEKHGKNGHNLHERMFFQQDTNKDGVVSREEWNASSDAHFKKLDVNGDGKITKEEAAEAHKKFMEEHKKHRDEKGPKGPKPAGTHEVK